MKQIHIYFFLRRTLGCKPAQAWRLSFGLLASRAAS